MMSSKSLTYIFDIMLSRFITTILNVMTRVTNCIYNGVLLRITGTLKKWEKCDICIIISVVFYELQKKYTLCIRIAAGLSQR